jgi:hypothetical protein
MPNQFSKKRFPSVPTPDDTVKGMLACMIVMKKCIDMLTGNDNQSKEGSKDQRFAPHVFLQNNQPDAAHEGDLWLMTGGNMTFNIWDGNRWLKITTLPA